MNSRTYRMFNSRLDIVNRKTEKNIETEAHRKKNRTKH